MFVKRLPECLLVASAAVAVLISVAMPETENQKATLNAQGYLDFKQYFTLRRNYFFGHKEMSDIATGMSVLANTVDAFQGVRSPGFAESKVKARFESSMDDTKFLSRFAIGMNDIYIFPALFYAFEEENPARAMELVELGMRDSRTDIKVPLLGAFISHIFVRDFKKAGELYKTVYTKYKAPEWIDTLANKLLTGEDPYLSTPAYQEKLSRIINRSFPKAKAYFQRQEEKRRSGEMK